MEELAESAELAELAELAEPAGLAELMALAGLTEKLGAGWRFAERLPGTELHKEVCDRIEAWLNALPGWSVRAGALARSG